MGSQSPETQSSGIPIESISTTEFRELIIPHDDGTKTTVLYRREGREYDPEDTFLVRQWIRDSPNERIRGRMTIEDLRGGDEGERAVYTQIMGDNAKGPPEVNMYQFNTTAKDGSVNRNCLMVFTEKTDDGQTRYRVRSNIVHEGAGPHTSGYMTLEEWKQKEDVYGKEWLDKFEKAILSQQTGEGTDSGFSEGRKMPENTTKFTMTKKDDKSTINVNVEYWRTDDTDNDQDARYTVCSEDDKGRCFQICDKSLEDLQKIDRKEVKAVCERIVQESQTGSSDVSDTDTDTDTDTSTSTVSSPIGTASQGDITFTATPTPTPRAIAAN